MVSRARRPRAVLATDPTARPFVRSVAAYMHRGFAAFRTACPMDLGRAPSPIQFTSALAHDVGRVDHLFTHARTRFGAGGPFLFGAFGAADAMYAPVAARIHAYALPVGPEARAYVDAVLAHPWLREWVDAIGDEPGISGDRL